MYRPAYVAWCPWKGFGAFLGPWRGSDTVGRGSSVELPFYDVHRHVECVRRQDHGDPEWVAIPQEGQEVIGAGLGHHR